MLGMEKKNYRDVYQSYFSTRRKSGKSLADKMAAIVIPGNLFLGIKFLQPIGKKEIGARNSGLLDFSLDRFPIRVP